MYYCVQSYSGVYIGERLCVYILYTDHCWIMSAKGMVKRMAAHSRERWAEPLASKIDETKSPVHRAANASTIISAVVIGVVALVGILIFAQIDEALPTPENEDLADASTSLGDGFAGAMELVPIVILVLIAALVISVVQRMRMQQ